MDLRKKFVKGIAWNGLAKFLGQGLQTITTIVLARILSPNEFGIIGMANIFILFANTINQLGIASAIVQRKEIDEGHLSSAFWVNMLTGMTLCGLMIVISFPAAKFFNNAYVQPVLATLSFIFIFGALRIVQNAQFSRKLEFKKLATIGILEMLANSVLAIVLALKGWGVWSLVWGRIFGVCVGVIMAWMLSSWRPKFIFHTQKFQELFRFGMHAMSVNILTYFGKNIDYIIVGRFLGTAPLGLYTMAYNLVTLPERKMSSIITGVAFPTFSRIQDDDERVAKNYLKMISYISLLTFPALLGLMLVSPHFVHVILGPKWIPIIGPMQVMCVLGIFSSIATTMGSIFYAKGRPDIEFKADLIYLTVLTVSLLFTVKYGIMAVAITVTTLTVIGTPIIFWFICRLIKSNLKEVYLAVRPALISSLSMCGVLWVSDFGMHNLGFNLLTRLIALIIVGAGSYFGFHKLYRFDDLAEVYTMVMTGLKERKEVAVS